MFKRTLDIGKLLKLKSFFLFGPRGTGKSTFIHQTFSDAAIYDLLDDEIYQTLLRRPAALLELAHQKPVIIVDEIQKLPKLLDEVHRILTKVKNPPRFLLTGSSARKLKRGAGNLLAGRAWEAAFFPLTSHEIDDFDLLRYLNHGGLPHIYLSEHSQEELQSYVSLYLREEIQVEANLRNLDIFVRFLDLLALSNGEEINLQGFASDCGVNPKTVANYFSILKDTLLGWELPAYRKTKMRKAIARSKFYYFDVGVAGFLAKRGKVLEGSELFGKAFEHFIIMEIMAYNSYRRKHCEIAYWRSTSQMEVDLVINDEIAIEIKSTNLVQEKHLKGLKALREEGIFKKFIVISTDSHPRIVDGISIVPWKNALQDLWRDRLI